MKSKLLFGHDEACDARGRKEQVAIQPLEGGSNPSTRTFNKKDYHVVIIEAKVARLFVVKWHYSNVFPNATKCLFGMFHTETNNLVGVCCLGIPPGRMVLQSIAKTIERKTFEKESLELTRLCLRDEVPQNAESWFISKCLREIMKKKYKFVISYSDPHQKHIGTIYQATDFFYCGTMKQRSDYDYFINGKWTHTRALGHKHGKVGHGRILELYPNVKYRKKSAKHKYIKILSSHPKERKFLFECMKRAGNFPKPYPKLQ